METVECDELTRAFVELEGATFKSDDIDPYWNDRFIWYKDVAAARPESGRLLLSALRRAQRSISEFYRLQAPIYPDLLQIVRWKTGSFMPPHADNANPDGASHQMAYRDLSGVIYLNDDFEGGELYFTALDLAIKPKRGMLVAMTAGFHHEHAVLRIESGTRLTIPLFFTFEKGRLDLTLGDRCICVWRFYRRADCGTLERSVRVDHDAASRRHHVHFCKLHSGVPDLCARSCSSRRDRGGCHRRILA